MEPLSHCVPIGSKILSIVRHINGDLNSRAAQASNPKALRR